MKGFLTFLILRMISKKSMSGDEIRDEMEKRKGCRPSPGTVYPVLKELSRNGLIEEVKESGREKKYKITPSGQKELKIAVQKFVALFYDLKDEFA
ncbi:PadR family transcriptional regulator [Candidatus Woesearchaeota archaeon]|nr:PadR family transcriptional regulator [Candidatus Woesearchaeota archaeon]